MMNKLLLTLAMLAVPAMAGAKSYTVTLFQPTTIGGAELKPGEYKLDVQDAKVMIRAGKTAVAAEVKVETNSDKFSSTALRYQNGDGKFRLQEIRLGGTKTKLVFN